MLPMPERIVELRSLGTSRRRHARPLASPAVYRMKFSAHQFRTTSEARRMKVR